MSVLLITFTGLKMNFVAMSVPLITFTGLKMNTECPFYRAGTNRTREHRFQGPLSAMSEDGEHVIRVMMS